MAAKKDKNATLVGFFLFLGLLALGIMVAQFGRLSSAFGDDYEIHVKFGDASGLVKDSDVTYGGAKIGRVTTYPVLKADGQIQVTLSLKGGQKIPDNAVFSITSVSLLGDKAVSIRRPENPSTTFLEAGQTVNGAGGGGFDDITDTAQNIATNTNDAIKDFRKMAKKLDSSIDHFDTMVVELNQALKTINTSVLTEGNTKSIKKTLENIELSSNAIQETTANLKPLFAEAKGVIADVKTATKTAEKTFAKASVQIDNLEPALKELPTTLSNLRSASTKATTMMDKIGGVSDGAKAFLAKLNNSQGLLKTLTSDKQVQSDVKSFVKNLKEQGVLRYKDAETSKKDDPRSSRFQGSRR